jgi:hypothetical protein
MCLRVCLVFATIVDLCVTFQIAAADFDFVSAYCKGFTSRGIRLLPLHSHFLPTGVLYKGRAEMACELFILLSPLDCTCVLLTDALKIRPMGTNLKFSSVLTMVDSLYRIYIRHCPLSEISLIYTVFLNFTTLQSACCYRSLD